MDLNQVTIPALDVEKTDIEFEQDIQAEMIKKQYRLYVIKPIDYSC
ncbi:hypothetical protein [Flavivirga sp. 57AJ16]|nr:hypothetical protein [Flavivirga sp. 57AJ16]MDD7884951.1 hypothetical protein [Flavivirga sp. 57AJ16]